MAAAALNTLSIDPSKHAKYPITISEQLLGKVERGSRQHALLHFNHKPKLTNSLHETTISPSPSHSDNSCNLSIKVDSDGSAYSYTGSQRGSEACALIYDPESQTLTLDKISTEFGFNLHATPTNKNSKALASQYPHIPTGDSEPESNSDDASTGADVNNPYDYRHFLKRRRTSSPEPLPSTTLVPTSPPRNVPVRQKPKPRPRPQPKRAPSPAPHQEDADNEDSDDGGLTIELDPDAKPRRINPAFTHDISKGPISLRSAASSVSPAVSVSSDEDEDVEQLILEPITALTPGEEEKKEVEEEEGDDEEEDEEEEEEGEEEEDDGEGSLEAELEQALESQADEDESGGVQIYGNGVVNGLGLNGVRTEMPVNPIVDESSSESEEE